MDPSHRPLRIAMLAPIAWRVPPRAYGPWERVVSILTEGLVARGADVTLFATADSRTSARLAAVAPRPYAEPPGLDAKVWECLHIAHAFERAAEFDLIHNHFDFLPLSYSALVRTPVLTTIHGFSSERILPVYERYNDATHYVAISDADRHSRLDYAATIHHGIPLEEFTFRREPDDYLLFFGRIHPDKGAAEAIAVARQAGRRLLLAGIVHDEAYFAREVAPHLDGDRVAFMGLADPCAGRLLCPRRSSGTLTPELPEKYAGWDKRPAQAIERKVSRARTASSASDRSRTRSASAARSAVTSRLVPMRRAGRPCSSVTTPAREATWWVMPSGWIAR